MCAEPCGTETTMAPEVINGDPYDPTLGDVWSFGIIVLAMFSSRTPDEYTCDEHRYYAWSSARDDGYEDGAHVYEDRAYGRYVTLRNDAAAKATTPGTTAIAQLLQKRDEHDRKPQELPAAVLEALDRMLCIDPRSRISAADVVSLLKG